MKKLIILLTAMLLAFSLIACGEQVPTPEPPEEEKVTLIDLAGKTEAEILTTFNNQLNIQFVYIESDSVESGTFLQYYGSRNIGDQVNLNTTVRIEIAGQKPNISGLDDIYAYVSIPGHENELDLETGVSAENYLGDTIDFGQYLYIVGYLNASLEPISEINLYVAATYYAIYRASDVTTKFSNNVNRKVIIQVPPFDTNHTDALRLTEAYEGKSFIDDGIGEVVLAVSVDADTTNFRDPHSTTLATRFPTRYLGIDAPEATSSFEPWGIPAAAFVREKLETADKIILQAQKGANRTDSNGRYLAWVWYVKNGQTRLLNLELVEQAYAYATVADSSSYYGEILGLAAQETVLTRKRIHGEIDPDFDYSSDGTPITIGDLIANFAEYAGTRKVILTGVVITKIGNSFYLESEGEGIYVYAGFNPTPEIRIGDEVVIQGLMPAHFPSDSPGKQVSNYKYYNMTVVSSENVVTTHQVLPNQIGSYVGRLVGFNNLEIIGIDRTQTGTYDPYTIKARHSSGQVIDIRVDAVVANVLPSHTIVIGTFINVSGPVNQYYNNYQLMLPGLNYIEFLEGGE